MQLRYQVAGGSAFIDQSPVIQATLKFVAHRLEHAYKEWLISYSTWERKTGRAARKDYRQLWPEVAQSHWWESTERRGETRMSRNRLPGRRRPVNVV